VPSLSRWLAVGLVGTVIWVTLEFASTARATRQQATVMLTGKNVAQETRTFDYDPVLGSTFITRKWMGAD
jgi:hypothetical protein